jgi:hypothetical protein
MTLPEQQSTDVDLETLFLDETPYVPPKSMPAQTLEEQRRAHIDRLVTRFAQIETFHKALLKAHAGEWAYVFRTKDNGKYSVGFTPSVDAFMDNNFSAVREYAANYSLVTLINLAKPEGVEILLSGGRTEYVRPSPIVGTVCATKNFAVRKDTAG